MLTLLDLLDSNQVDGAKDYDWRSPQAIHSVPPRMRPRVEFSTAECPDRRQPHESPYSEVDAPIGQPASEFFLELRDEFGRHA